MDLVDSLKPNLLINQNAKSFLYLSRIPNRFNVVYISFFFFFFFLHPYPLSMYQHSHGHTHWLCISNYSRTQGNWHYWHRLDHSLVQLLFQSSRSSIFWNYATSPISPPHTPTLSLSLSQHLSLTHPASPLLLFLLLPCSSSRWLHALEEGSSGSQDRGGYTTLASEISSHQRGFTYWAAQLRSRER